MVDEPDDRFLPTVPFLPFGCPNCGKFKPKTYSVNKSPRHRTMRYHTCQNCGQRYRSVQITRSDMAQWLPDHLRKHLPRDPKP